MAKLVMSPLSRALNSVAQVLWFTPYIFMCAQRGNILLALRSIGDWWKSRWLGLLSHSYRPANSFS